jgi:hypothetical protein
MSRSIESKRIELLSLERARKRTKLPGNTIDQDTIMQKWSVGTIPTNPKQAVFGRVDSKSPYPVRQASCRHNEECSQALEQKEEKGGGAGVFRTNQELRMAVNIYYHCKYVQFTPKASEFIAKKYGWIINKWNVSAVEDFTGVFEGKGSFNDYIGDWNVSSGTKFVRTFHNARAFNQDVSKWDLKNAETLDQMFHNAASFRQNLSGWRIPNKDSTSCYAMFADSGVTKDEVEEWSLVNYDWIPRVHATFCNMFEDKSTDAEGMDCL